MLRRTKHLSNLAMLNRDFKELAQWLNGRDVDSDTVVQLGQPPRRNAQLNMQARS